MTMRVASLVSHMPSHVAHPSRAFTHRHIRPSRDVVVGFGFNGMVQRYHLHLALLCGGAEPSRHRCTAHHPTIQTTQPPPQKRTSAGYNGWLWSCLVCLDRGVGGAYEFSLSLSL